MSWEPAAFIIFKKKKKPSNLHIIHPFLFLENDGGRPASHAKSHKQLFGLPTYQRKWKVVNYLR